MHELQLYSFCSEHLGIVFLSKSLSFHKAPNKEEEEEEVNKDNLVRHDLQCGDFDKEAKEKSCDDGYDELSQDDEHLEALSAQEARQVCVRMNCLHAVTVYVCVYTQTKVMKWKKSKQRLKSSPRQCSLCQASFSNLLKRKVLTYLYTYITIESTYDEILVKMKFPQHPNFSILTLQLL